jgi:hypothetical protein
VLSYLAMRRRGIGSGLRGAAWSLLPVAAYLTGAIEMFWKMGIAIGDFATGFVFSPKVWSGIAVAGFSALLFVVSGPLRRRRVKRGQEPRATETAAGPAGALSAATPGSQLTTRSDPKTARTAPVPAKAPVKARKGKGADDDDDDLGDVADILRRHGIN